MIDTLIDQRWEELAEAIVRQAMVDYRKAFRVSRKIAKTPEQRRRKAKADKEIKEINEFLHSGWFGVLLKCSSPTTSSSEGGRQSRAR